MNKKQVGVISLACGLILGSVGVGYAANQYVQALLNQEIKVSLNGKIQEFKDVATGETMYPLTYKDRTYLPLRNVAELSGLDVDYDNDTKTAILNKRASKYFKVLVDQGINNYKLGNVLDDGQELEVEAYASYGEGNITIKSGEKILFTKSDFAQGSPSEIYYNASDKCIYVIAFIADGYCYESEGIYKIDMKNDFSCSLIASFSCDDEAEDEKRKKAFEDYYSQHGIYPESIEDIDYIHILKFSNEKGERIEKEEYDNIVRKSLGELAVEYFGK